MSKPTQPANWPSPRGPWHEAAHDLSRIFDAGATWCADAEAHPDPEAGYPDHMHHVPWNECRSLSVSFDDVKEHLAGPLVALEIYAATPFQFGQPRDQLEDRQPRIVIEHYPDGANDETTRISLGLGEALRLARHITCLVDRAGTPAYRTRSSR